MLRKSPASNAWAAISKNTNFYWFFTALKVTKLGKLRLLLVLNSIK